MEKNSVKEINRKGEKKKGKKGGKKGHCYKSDKYFLALLWQMSGNISCVPIEQHLSDIQLPYN